MEDSAEVLALEAPVRQVPLNTPGYLLLLRTRTGEIFLQWQGKTGLSGDQAGLYDSYRESLQPLEKDARPQMLMARLSSQVEDEGDFCVSFEQIEGISADSDSATLLVVVDSSRSSNPVKLLHFLQGDPTEFISRSTRPLSSFNRSLEEVPPRGLVGSNDLGWTVMEQFSRIKSFYASVAESVLGEASKRPRSPQDPRQIPENPWISPRVIHLPDTSVTADGHGLRLDEIEDENSFTEWILLKRRIYTTGCADMAVRRRIWPALFGLRHPEQEDWMREKRLVYQKLLSQIDQPEILSQYRESFARIDKDVYRTDRNLDFFHPQPHSIEHDLELPNLRALCNILHAYCLWDSGVEYVQGMNDLLSPLYFVVGEEALAFWMFTDLMQRQRDNFIVNGKGMQDRLCLLGRMVQIYDPQLADYLNFYRENVQLFFCYRWLLVLFKRELAFPQVLRLWEAIMTASSPKFDLFLALAIIDLHKGMLRQTCHSFDDTLRYFNSLAMSIQAEEILGRADQLLVHFQTDPLISRDRALLRELFGQINQE